jgi:hypothetical protein
MNATLRIATAALALGAITAPAALGQEEANAAFRPGATVFLNQMPEAFDTFLKAALLKKKVPVSIVDAKELAAFEISGTSETQKASTAKKLILLDFHSDEQASISVVDRKSGEIVFAYSVNKKSSAHGKQSTAEACAVHIKDELEKHRRK